MRLLSVALGSVFVLVACHRPQSKTSSQSPVIFPEANEKYRSAGEKLKSTTYTGEIVEAMNKSASLKGKSCEVVVDVYSGEKSPQGESRPQADVTLKIEYNSSTLLQRGLEQQFTGFNALDPQWAIPMDRATSPTNGADPYFVVAKVDPDDKEKLLSVTAFKSASGTNGFEFLLTCQLKATSADDAMAVVRVESTSVRGGPVTLIGSENGEASCHGGNAKYKSVGTFKLSVPTSVTKISICGMAGGGAGGGMDWKEINVGGKLRSGETLIIRNDAVVE